MEICWQDGEHSQNQYVLTQQHFRVLVLACSTLMWDCGLFKDHSNSTNHYRLSDRLMNCSIMLAIANHKHWHFKFCNWSLTTKFIIKKNEKKKFFFGLNSLSPPPPISIQIYLIPQGVIVISSFKNMEPIHSNEGLVWHLTLRVQNCWIHTSMGPCCPGHLHMCTWHITLMWFPNPSKNCREQITTWKWEGVMLGIIVV